MEAFINEKSLHGQFSAHNIETEMIEFLKVMKLLNQAEPRFLKLISLDLFNSQALPGVHFDATLKGHPSLHQVLLTNLKDTINWNGAQVHDNHSQYTHNQISYTGFSIAEIAERKIMNAEHVAVALNFTNSIFTTSLTLNVSKNTTHTTDFPCAFNENSIKKWLEYNGFINTNVPYDIKLKRPPEDHETVFNNGQFEETQYKRNKGRAVYRRIGTNELWAVDNRHFGKGAHIEVFSEINGRHLGTSKHDRVLVEAKYIRPRKIDLN